MRRVACVWLLVAIAACGEPSSPSSPSPSPAPLSTGVTLSTLEVDPSVLGGQTARATVTLSAPAPADGVAISISASGAAATVPVLLTVPAGATTATFDVATTPVAITKDVTITAQAGGVTRTASLRLRIDPTSLKPSANYTIGFSGLRDNRAAAPTYTESGFTVSQVSAQWVGITTYGNPLPSLQFFASGGTVTGELRIAAGGVPFWLRSIDFYSSVTRIPYVIEGFLSGEAAFIQLEVLGNTFGNFVRVTNARADLPVDVLLIRLSNPIPPGVSGTNPMGVDNVVLNR
jgi:hypothetical protein